MYYGRVHGEPWFVSRNPVATLAKDFYNFTAFLLFVALVFAIGGPLRLIDRVFGTRLLDGFIRFFEFCA